MNHTFPPETAALVDKLGAMRDEMQSLQKQAIVLSREIATRTSLLKEWIDANEYQARICVQSHQVSDEDIYYTITRKRK